MIFCLPYEVCDCLSKSIASIAFTARFNFLFSDVIKGRFRTGSKDVQINEQMYPSSAVHSPHDSVADFLISRQPHTVPQSGDAGTAVSLSLPQSPKPCWKERPKPYPGLSLDLWVTSLVLWRTDFNFIVMKAKHTSCSPCGTGDINERKNILPCFKDIQKLQNFWKLDQSESS